MYEKRDSKLYESAGRDASVPLVMVVDDEPNMCNILQRILKKEGYNVVIAPDGDTALRLIPEEKPQVILLDIMMPGMDGREVCVQARKVCDSRIIYFSARTDVMRSKQARGTDAEADAFLPKPTTSRRILSTIDLALGRG